MKIVEALAGFENDPKFNLGNYGYTLRRAKGKGASGFIAYKNEVPRRFTVDLKACRAAGPRASVDDGDEGGGISIAARA